MERKVVIPYNTALSKNRAKEIHGWGKRKTIGLTKEYKGLLELLINEMKPQLQGSWIDKKKVWVLMQVQKPNHKSDAINIIDGICDVIKKCIPVDDRYYSVMVDWEIKKENPMVEIRVVQGE